MSDQSLGGLPDATSRMGKTSDESFPRSESTNRTMLFDARQAKGSFNLYRPTGAIWRERFCVLIDRLQVAPTYTQEVFTVNGKILCVESDPFLLESRCAVLKYSGYDASSASPQLAEILLRSQKFDLIVISTVSDQDLHRIVNFSDGAEVLVLDRLTMPSKLLSLVAQRLQQRA